MILEALILPYFRSTFYYTTPTKPNLRFVIEVEARYNLATRVMSNGVEVIVAGDKSTLPGEPDVKRVLPSTIYKPVTLKPSTLSDYMMMIVPQDASNVRPNHFKSNAFNHSCFRLRVCQRRCIRISSSRRHVWLPSRTWRRIWKMEVRLFLATSRWFRISRQRRGTRLKSCLRLAWGLL